MLKKKIVYVAIASAIPIAIIFCILGYWRLSYYDELNSIKNRLNAINNVSVVNIWGHHDITLEEVTARLRVEGKGEIVLYGLSNDVYNYPVSVPISEIGGYSFRVFYDGGSGFGSSIDIGREGAFGEFFPFNFPDEQEVIHRYDEILKVVTSWPVFPELKHFYSKSGEEIFLAVIPQKNPDIDPIYLLYGVDDVIKFAKSLPWEKQKAVEQ
jgi:hypothetical protein